MFGLEFLFGAALWALPLAGLPVVLHLLFRRKSPIVPFSTLRFIKSSIQQTAARKRVQRWLLLATRGLLLLLLIWAVSQPAKKLASNWMGGGGKRVAAIVVDTSYSMELRQGQTTLLERADGMVQGLLRHQLKDAEVAIFRSLPAPADRPESLMPVGRIESQWTALKPQANPAPLADRVNAAVDLLKRQEAGQKWLIVISDMQSREFAHPVWSLPGGRTIFLDLHPDHPRSAAIVDVLIHPEQPISGVGSAVSVEVAAKAKDRPRAVGLTIRDPAGKAIYKAPAAMARFDAGGRAQARFGVEIPAGRWMLLEGALDQDEALAWAGKRTELVEASPRRTVRLFDAAGRPDVERFLRLLLDPSEGKNGAWPLKVEEGDQLTGKEEVAVVPLTDWPDEKKAARLRDFARGGGTVILMLQPGLERSWGSLGAGRKRALASLLPSAPERAVVEPGIYAAAVAAPGDGVMKHLSGKEYEWNRVLVSRFVPLDGERDRDVTTLLTVSAVSPGAGSRPEGLLFRRKIGSGQVYTLGTLPDMALATPPPFLPLMVSLCLRPPEQNEALNVELGGRLVLSGARYAGYDRLEIEGPGHARYVIKPTEDGGGRRFIFDKAEEPGIYVWRKPGEEGIVAMTEVQYPAAEADLTYREGRGVVTPGANVVVARSLSDLERQMAQMSRPEPRWSMPIAIVLFLLCLEALMGSLGPLWRPIWRPWAAAAARKA